MFIKLLFPGRTSFPIIPYLVFPILLVFTTGCRDGSREPTKPFLATKALKRFNNYWGGEAPAEINRYRLTQARYGESHNGYILQIFVPEHFLPEKQVKDENNPARSGSIRVLKLNQIRRFVTGLYDYSLMTSVFQPIDSPRHPVLKITHSGQDWCGQLFSQLNYRAGKYQYRLFSYFGDESDQEKNLPRAFPEDALFTQLRLGPDSLPVGNTTMIPAAHFLRLRHQPAGARKVFTRRKTVTRASTSLRQALNEIKVAGYENPPAEKISIYQIEYKDLDRSVEIAYKPNFPYTVLAWRETGPNGFGPDSATGETLAVLTHQEKQAYWQLQAPRFREMRDRLGLGQK